MALFSWLQAMTNVYDSDADDRDYGDFDAVKDDSGEVDASTPTTITKK